MESGCSRMPGPTQEAGLSSRPETSEITGSSNPWPQFHRCPYKQLLSPLPEHAGGKAFASGSLLSSLEWGLPMPVARKERRGDMEECSQAIQKFTGSRAQSSACANVDPSHLASGGVLSAFHTPSHLSGCLQAALPEQVNRNAVPEPAPRQPVTVPPEQKGPEPTASFSGTLSHSPNSPSARTVGMTTGEGAAAASHAERGYPLLSFFSTWCSPNVLAGSSPHTAPCTPKDPTLSEHGTSSCQSP